VHCGRAVELPGEKLLELLHEASLAGVVAQGAAAPLPLFATRSSRGGLSRAGSRRSCAAASESGEIFGSPSPEGPQPHLAELATTFAKSRIGDSDKGDRLLHSPQDR